MATPTYVGLGNTTLGTATNTVTFSDLSGYRDYVVVIEGETTSGTRPVMRMNGDSTSSYSSIMFADDGGTSYATTTSGTFIDPLPGYSNTGRFSAIWQVQDASATDRYKSVLVRFNQSTGSHVHAAAGKWANTTAVSSITLTTSTGVTYAIGTQFAIYGIEA